MPNCENEFVTAPDIAEAARQAATETSSPLSIVQSAINERGINALLEDAVIDALKTVRTTDPREYARIRVRANGLKSQLDQLTASDGESREASIQDKLIEIVKEHCTLAHDADGQGIAIINVDGVRQTWRTNSQGFADWVRAQAFAIYECAINDAALMTVIQTAGAIGKFQGEEVAVHCRYAFQNGAYYIDLCDEAWRVIKVDASGWRILDEAPVYFLRSSSMRSLPTPATDGDLAPLWRHINAPEEVRPLVLAWIIDSMRPDTPFPILEITGEQGSSKSYSQRRLRELIDPNKVPLRGRPKAIEDIYVAAANSWMVSFENLSGLTAEQQDALCTLSTGSGFATRQLYTNGEEHVLEAKRPVMINGINPVATQPDLIERTISIEAPIIPQAQRREETALLAAWEEDYPKIFAGLLELFSRALAHLPDVELETKFRMADFHILGEAIGRALGLETGEFTSVYGKQLGLGMNRSLETYGITNALECLLFEHRNGWEGTVLQLLAALSSQIGTDRSHWPRSARNLSGQLKRLAPGLRQRGIQIEHLGHTRTGAQVRITMIG